MLSMAVEQLSQVFGVKAALEQYPQPTPVGQHTFTECLEGSVVSGRVGELICDHCRGLGHVRRACPSSIRFSSVQQAIEALMNVDERAVSRDTSAKAYPQPVVKRSPVNTRSQPRRFQGKGKSKGVRIAEDAHTIEVVPNSDKAKTNVEPRVMPLAMMMMKYL